MKMKESLLDNFVKRGTWRIRTAVCGFADRCLTSRPKYLVLVCKDRTFFLHSKAFSRKMTDSYLLRTNSLHPLFLRNVTK
jgi:hypothetical protein